MGGPRAGADTQSLATSTSSAGSAERSSLPGRRCLASLAVYLLAGSDLLHGHLPRALVRKYFGRPARIFHTGPYTVLVWNRNLLLSIPR